MVVAAISKVLVLQASGNNLGEAQSKTCELLFFVVFSKSQFFSLVLFSAESINHDSILMATHRAPSDTCLLHKELFLFTGLDNNVYHSYFLFSLPAVCLFLYHFCSKLKQFSHSHLLRALQGPTDTMQLSFK